MFDVELISHLYFTGEKFGGAANNNLFTFWHVTDDGASPPTLSPVPLVAMISPSDTIFKKQLNLVDGYADLREDRAAEILAQLTPPVAFWSSITNLHPQRHRFTVELLDSALRLAGYVEQRFKHALACLRPVELSPQVQPMILTPGHGALPSGHGTEAHLAAWLLWTLMNQKPHDVLWRVQLLRQAARVTINRTIAGVHFPVDSAAGQLLGFSLAEYFLMRCNGGGNYKLRRFNGLNYGDNDNFEPYKFYDPATGNFGAPAYLEIIGNANAVGESSLLKWLWEKAKDEWD